MGHAQQESDTLFSEEPKLNTTNHHTRFFTYVKHSLPALPQKKRSSLERGRHVSGLRLATCWGWPHLTVLVSNAFMDDRYSLVDYHTPTNAEMNSARPDRMMPIVQRTGWKQEGVEQGVVVVIPHVSPQHTQGRWGWGTGPIEGAKAAREQAK